MRRESKILVGLSCLFCPLMRLATREATIPIHLLLPFLLCPHGLQPADDVVRRVPTCVLFPVPLQQNRAPASRRDRRLNAQNLPTPTRVSSPFRAVGHATLPATSTVHRVRRPPGVSHA